MCLGFKLHRNLQREVEAPLARVLPRLLQQELLAGGIGEG